ncbi:hypothetical protein LguiB_016558 [Lonicera macranthoides]
MVKPKKNLIIRSLDSPPLSSVGDFLQPGETNTQVTLFLNPLDFSHHVEGKKGIAASKRQKAAMASTKVQRIMTQPINLIFRFLQSKARIQIWLFEQKDLRIEGRIIGFDEYMNLVLDDAEEVSIKKKSRKQLGRILLKGDNITLMMNTGK